MDCHSVKKGSLRQVEIRVRVAEAHMRAAEDALQYVGSVELALSHLIMAGIVFSDCLDRLTQLRSSTETLNSGLEAADPLEAIFPTTLRYSKDHRLLLKLLESCPPVLN